MLKHSPESSPLHKVFTRNQATISPTSLRKNNSPNFRRASISPSPTNKRRGSVSPGPNLMRQHFLPKDVQKASANPFLQTLSVVDTSPTKRRSSRSELQGHKYFHQETGSDASNLQQFKFGGGAEATPTNSLGQFRFGGGAEVTPTTSLAQFRFGTAEDTPTPPSGHAKLAPQIMRAKRTNEDSSPVSSSSDASNNRRSSEGFSLYAELRKKTSSESLLKRRLSNRSNSGELSNRGSMESNGKITPRYVS
jgi:hypothetical protein